MKVSLKWLGKYFDAPLPSAEKLADTLTFHAFEIEEASGDLLDVKVLPNRAADCLSHRGIATEISAILTLPLKEDPLRAPLPEFPATESLAVEIEDSKKCLRYMGAVVRGVKVGPSPAWLKEALEAVGQRSINNVVDATNYVMLNIGQPLHAFDLGKLSLIEDRARICVRRAMAGEKITTLSNDIYELKEGTLLITDGNSNAPIGIAGIKGGKMAEVTEDTTDLVIESANFDGTTVRRGAQSLRLFTDASARFQNRPSPELAAYGMRDVLALITDIAGGTIEGVADVFRQPADGAVAPVRVSLSRINALLGSAFSMREVEDVFSRLGLSPKIDGEVCTITPPFERTDLLIPEDLVEEVGRISGYEIISSTELPSLGSEPDQRRYHGIERMKDQLVEEGYTEVSTQSFEKDGDIYLANPLDKNNPALRKTLSRGINKAGILAVHYAPRILAPHTPVKIFEIGTIFEKDGEHVELLKSEFSRKTRSSISGAGSAQVFLSTDDLPLDDSYIPKKYTLGAYKPFSTYPFVLRDIALWVPAGTETAAIENMLRENAGELLVRLDQFDRFEKEGRVSYAFSLVFESPERTLTDEEVNKVMEKVTTALTEKGFQVR